MPVQIVSLAELGHLSAPSGSEAAFIVEAIEGVADLVVLLPPYGFTLSEFIPLGRGEDHTSWSRSLGKPATRRVKQALAASDFVDDPPYVELPSYSFSPGKAFSFCPIGKGRAAADRMLSTYAALGIAASFKGQPWDGNLGDAGGARLAAIVADYALEDKDVAILQLGELAAQVIDLESSIRTFPLAYRNHLWIPDSLISRGTRPGHSGGYKTTIDRLNLARAEFLSRIASPLFLIRWRELHKALGDSRTAYEDGVIPEQLQACCREYLAQLEKFFPSLPLGAGFAELAQGK